jgi:hypothetical protein
VTTPDQLRSIVRYLQERIELGGPDERAIVFDPPGADRMVADGLDETTVRRLLAAPWWREMVDDVLETLDFAEPDETNEQVLDYARDVIQEYIGKRFPLDG